MASSAFMKLYQYRDYADYVAAQVSGNRRKLDRTWAREATIRSLATYMQLDPSILRLATGICHGTRRGDEQRWFREALPDCQVVGTEIAPTASQFPHTLQWDFHETQPAWIGAMDFVYSNSFDHAYDPPKALSAWLSCLRPWGVCLIEHSREHGPAYANRTDPFGAEIAEMPALLNEWGAGRYAVRNVLPAPGSKFRDTAVFVIGRTGKTPS